MPRFVARWMVVPALASTLGVMAGCATNPVTGHREFSLVTSEQELQIGSEGYKAVVAEYGLYEDPAVQEYVNQVGQKVARVSHLPNLSWKFTVVDDPAVNAFAMPGGYIYVTRGILPYLNSEAELAGVLGHEIGHVTARHSAQRITQQQLAGLGLGLASIFSETFRTYGQAAQTALGLLFLKYGREDENEADALGVQYSTAAGYDSRRMPETYHMLQRVSEKSGQRLPTFLSTHPDPGGRAERTQQLAQQATQGKTGLVVAERAYVQKQDGMVFGRDPREGYFDRNHYYHPTMRFQMDFPSGWKTQDSKSAVMAASTDERAVMQLSMASRSDLSPAAFVAELERAGKITGSRGRSETIGGSPAWIGLLGVRNSQGQTGTLRAVFIRRSSDRMFQILGSTPQPEDAYDAEIVESARSFRDLNDPSRISVQPARVDVISVPRTTSFQSLVQSLGPLAAGIEDLAIMNHVESDQDVRTGELVKVVVKR